jgi:hypothetical protein
MTRKLLPYEYALIEHLGVSKEEYLEFLALQIAYNDPKEGTILDIRNVPVVAIALTVIGLIFTAVSTALAPKPQITQPRGVALAPTQAGPAVAIGVGGQAQTREQRFSPRFGFNGQQDLAKYGDPVNLIYTDIDINPNGGVRAGTSLVWSAVRSFGSTQFVQLLLALGAGGIEGISMAKSAFGQTTIEDLVSQNKWLYVSPQATGFLKWMDETSMQSESDPTFYGSANSNPYRLQLTAENVRVDGFSQAYSPASQNSFGMYGVVPINSLVYQRNASGAKESAILGITSTWNWQTLEAVAVGFEMMVTITSTKPDVGDVETQAQETRRALSSTFDDSGIFKLGSALFRVQSINTGSPDEGDMIIKLKCIEAGNAPGINYAAQSLAGGAEEYRKSITNTAEYINAKLIVDALVNEDDRVGYNSEYVGNLGGDIQYLQVPVAYTADNIINGTNVNAQLQAGYYYSTSQDNPLEFFSYSGPGIYKAQYNEVYGENGPYTVFSGYYLARAVTDAEKAAYTFLLQQDARIPTYKSEIHYYTKALARVETASYQTVQPCHVVDLAIKSRVSKRISGRQERYGRDNYGGYPVSDNGSKNRTALFLLKYKQTGQSFQYVPGVWAVSRPSEIENFNYIKFNSGLTLPADTAYWQFKLEAVLDAQSEISKHPELRNAAGKVDFFYIENSGDAVTINLTSLATIQYTGRRLESIDGIPPLNENPSGLTEWDLFNLDADNQLQFSFDNGPEFLLTCVTEQQIQLFSDFPRLYNNISLVGLNLFSGRNLQDLRSFTAFVTRGRRVRRLRTLGSLDENDLNWDSPSFNFYPAIPDGPTCYASDIFLDSVLDADDGIGKYAVPSGIDIKQLARSKQFCKANNLFMDGVIADPGNWREFWVQAATFSLLEFARIGGRETLVPAVPYNPNTGAIDRQINVSALYNQGNIIEGSYKEEYIDYGSNVQDIIASIVYRDTDSNGTFAINRTIEVRRNDITEADAIRQTFYTSQFVTDRSQAVLYGKFLCNTRHHIKTAVEFRTFPTQDPISPGAYIYLDIGQNAWNGTRTGIVGPSGALNIPLDNSLPDGTYKFLLYKSGNGVVSIETSVQSNAAAALASYDGWLFVLGTEVTSRRIFRVTEVQMDEEGEITVRAANYPCDSNGNSLIADFSDALFIVTGAVD